MKYGIHDKVPVYFIIHFCTESFSHRCRGTKSLTVATDNYCVFKCSLNYGNHRLAVKL